MLAFVFAIHKLLAMLLHLADNSLNDFPLVLIAISKCVAASCFKFSKVSLELSSTPAKLCKAKLATASRSCARAPPLDPARALDKPLWTSSVASRIHSCLHMLSPKIRHMLCKIKHVVTKSGTFFKATSILFNKIRHRSFSMPNARSTHIWVELWT